MFRPSGVIVLLGHNLNLQIADDKLFFALLTGVSDCQVKTDHSLIGMQKNQYFSCFMRPGFLVFSVMKAKISPTIILGRSFISAWRLRRYWPVSFFMFPTLLGFVWFHQSTVAAGEFPWRSIAGTMGIALSIGYGFTILAALVDPLLASAVREQNAGRRFSFSALNAENKKKLLRAALAGGIWTLCRSVLISLATVPFLLASYLSVGQMGRSIIQMTGALVALLVVLMIDGLNALSIRYAIFEDRDLSEATAKGYSLFSANFRGLLSIAFLRFLILVLILGLADVVVIGVQLIVVGGNTGESSAAASAVTKVILVLASVIFVGFAGLFSSAFWTHSFEELRHDQPK
jgi:hypothetical protein